VTHDDATRTLPLTGAQSGIWYAQRLEPDNPIFNLGQYLRIAGPVDADLLRDAFARTLGEVDAVRVRFEEQRDEPVQVLGDEPSWTWDVLDLSDRADPENAAREWMVRDMERTTDLAEDPLVTVRLLRVGDDVNLCYQRVHHIAMDGYGDGLVLARVAQVYDALAAGDDVPDGFFRPLADLVEEDRAYRASEEHEDHRAFWRAELEDRVEPVGLAPAPEGMSRRMRRAGRSVPADAADALRALADDAAVRLSSLVVACFAAYLHRSTGTRDVVLGLPVTGRRGAIAKTTPSMMSHVVPLRLRVGPERTLLDLARAVGDRIREVLPHQRVQTDEMLRDLGLPASTRLAGPALNIIPDMGTLTFAGSPSSIHNLAVGPVDDLSVVVMGDVDGHGLRVNLEANAALYEQDALDGHLQRFVNVLRHVLDEPGVAIGSLRIATDDDLRHAREHAAGAITDPPRRTLPELFAAQAVRTPDEVALVAHDGRLRFSEVDEAADRLAHVLRDRGVGVGDVVGVALPRCTSLPVALLAVAKAGAVYLPVDPALPDARIAAYLDDARPALVITDGAVAEGLPGGPAHLLLDDPDVRAAIDAAPATPLANELRESLAGPGDAAYVVFTSGSTGRPKGVVVEHAALVNLYAQHQREVFGPATAANGGPLRVAHATATSFDAAWDPILWMVAGHELHLLEDDTRHDPQALVGYLREHDVHAIETTPSFARELLAQGLLDHPDWDGVRVLALGGEEVDPALWDDLAGRDGLMAFNFFGPTETTVDAVTARIERGVGQIIGRPRRNVRAYVLDVGLDPAPVGVAGELYLAGAGLARGYLDRPGQTAERFVADPWGSDGERMYRTGDLARWRPDGTLEFAGRVDDQVKIRGFRVELAEVRAVVVDHPSVTTAAVVVREDAPGVQRLVAYVVTDGDVPPAELREHAAGRLPEYMVPSAWVAVAGLPLTPNGKLDQSRLPRPDTDDAAGADGPSRAPETPQEEHLAGLFADALGLPRVGADDDFFALGGHSLLATRLISRIRSELGVEIPVRELFETPTVAGLAARLGDAEGARPELGRRERPDVLPLSFAQSRLWFLNRLEPGSSAYNIPAVLRLRGPLDADALERAVADVVGRHEPLRTVFPEDEGGRPSQRILDPADVPTVLTREEAPDDVDGRVREIARGGFDLTAQPPLRVVLLRVAEDDHRLVLLLHHVAGDGWSMGPLARDLATAYAARQDGDAPEWGRLPVQYADYALWQQDVLGDEDDPGSAIAKQLSHWRDALADLPEELELPTDRPRPARAGDDVDDVPVRLDPDVRDALDELAREHGASVFMVLQAGLAALLSRTGAGDDVPIGSPIAGRTDEALDELVGFFVNTLVLRTDVSGDPTFAELVARVRETDLDAYAHQDVPFERLVEALQPERSLSRHPLFQVLLAFQNAPAAEPSLPGLDVELQRDDLDTGAKFDLSLDLGETPDGDRTAIAGTLAYRTDLFDRETITALADRLQRLLAAVAEDPSLRVSDVPVLHPDEERDLHEAHALPARPPAPSLLEVLDATVGERGDEVALRDDERVWTFAELDADARRLADGLRGRGLAGRTVGVALPRTGAGIVALLAVLRAGAVYLPLDLEHPDARLAAIAADARPALVLVQGADRERLPEDLPTADPDEVAGGPGTDAADTVSGTVAGNGAAPAASTAEDHHLPSPADAAYVLFTSGSTGRPKGVVVEHGALARLLQGHRERLIDPTAERAGRRLRVAHVTAVSFDAAWDPVLWMVAGHELRLVSDDDRRDAEALVPLLLDERIDVLETTPSWAEHLLGSGLRTGEDGPSLLLLGGEAVPATLWATLRERTGTTAINLYGPTETTVDALTGTVGDFDVPVVGAPVPGLATRVLDARLRPLPVGAAGELYLAGDGVARAYLGRPDLTAERFVADPFGPPGARMYRTGDLARRRRDGAIEFRGRTDDQVKVRGFRVELGEVEAALVDHHAVARAAVVVREDGAGGGRLAGYLVPADPDAGIDEDDVRAHAAGRLAAYMVPATLTTLDELPLTVNGKLDRRALPDPQEQATGRTPEGRVEEALAAAFADVLGVEAVGADDDFFALGGHSLLATRLVSAVRRELDAELPVRALFEAPTVATLALRVDAADAARPPIERVDEAGPVPLSYAQHRLWFLSRLDASTAAYHLPLAVRLHGPLDDAALERAIADVVARHEPLRTVLPEHEDGARQEILPADPAPVALERHDLDGHDLAATLRRLASVDFDLTTAPPLRAHLVRCGPDEHALLLVLHHVAVDGWSLGPLGRDLSAAYAARRVGRDPELPEPAVRYRDHAAWQRRVLGDESDPNSPFARQLAHWRERLADLPAETTLPGDRPRPAEASGLGDELRFALDADLHEAVLRLARDRGASAFMVLQSALAALLTRLGAGTDVPIGSPVAGRTDAALEDLVGFFVNTLVLRADTSGDPTFAELVDRVRSVDLDAFAHQDVPFERLVEELRPERSLSRHPLFQVMLTLGTGDERTVAPHLQDLDATPVPLSVGAAKFDLSLTLTEHHDDGAPAGLHGTLEYATDLFDRPTAERLLDRLRVLLGELVADPERRIGDVDLLSDDERRAVLQEWGAPGAGAVPADARDDATILAAFERTARRRPDDVALVDAGGPRTFAELDARANAIARTLHAHGHADDDRPPADGDQRDDRPARRPGVVGRVVGVAVGRSADAIAAALGVLKARGAYLPLDLAHPDDRLAAIVDDARPAVVLTAPEADGRLPTGTPALPIADVPEGADAPPEPAELDGPPARCDVAYVLFTSGSTGRPKGVVVEHRGLADLLAHHRERLFAPAVRRAGRDRLRVAHTTALSFDAAWDPLLWMVEGHELHLIDDETRHDPDALVATVARERLDVLETTPSYADGLLDLGLLDGDHAPALLALGGEAVTAATWQRLRAAGRTDTVNLYGPTESTVDAVVARVDEHDHPVIGRPVGGTWAYVLDDALRPLPPGVPGELYLAGVGVARAYLGRPDLTAERFVADPYGPPGGRMYRTGDRARRLADGTLEFGGRVDDQVKIRGFRVETGEIREALRAQDGVATAVVLTQDDPAGAAALVAYVVPEDGGTLDVDELRAALATRLPDYMVPRSITTLDALPLTVNGKLDRRALPTPTRPTGGAAPRTPRESELCALYADALGVEHVGTDESFFDLGGHSLLAARLVGRIRDELGVDVPVRALFEAPTVAGLATRLGDDAGDDAAGLRVLLPLRAEGDRPPLFCVHPASGLAWAYSAVLGHVPDDVPVHGLQSRGLVPGEAPPEDLEALVDDLIDEIRGVQPEGPYRLLGWSLGGTIAHRVACRLREDGDEVGLLALLDAFPSPRLDEPAADGGDAATLAAYLHAHDAGLDHGSGDLTPGSTVELLHRVDSPVADVGRDRILALARSFVAQARMVRASEVPCFDGDVLFVSADAEPGADRDPALRWRSHVTGEIHHLPAPVRHADLLGPEALAVIGPALRNALEPSADDVPTPTTTGDPR